MSYSSLEDSLLDLEKQGMLLRIKEEVDPHLEMAAIHLMVHAAGGPAILFEKVKGCKFRTASNIFGSLPQSEYLFRETLPLVRQLIAIKNDPLQALKSPRKYFRALFAGLKARPLRNPGKNPVLFSEINITDLPQIKHWPMDGGAFITLPQVYTEDPDSPGISSANIGMYRIQLSGNEYKANTEIGLHYQLHRGIGVHQTKANKKGRPLKVSIFIGGPPAHSLAAVMPLPEGLSEASFAGVVGGRRFRYIYKDGFVISTDADFVITGIVHPNENKPEGPFGDHLGYYSLAHDFPMMQVHRVYAKQHAIWPFTVVGRPPQEDTRFGQLIHSITGDALQNEIAGLKEIHAVDAAGVHPLLLAVGSERYTPYAPVSRPAEILTIAHHILGTGQLSLAKFLFIGAGSDELTTKNIPAFFQFMLERIDTSRDIHFYTNTTIDTLDYSGVDINSGSKVVFAAAGEVKRKLSSVIPGVLQPMNAKVVMPGVLALQWTSFSDYESAATDLKELTDRLSTESNAFAGIPMIILCDDSQFVSASLNNFLWVSFTRTNPSHDIYGVQCFTKHKHWGCTGPVLLDARSKPHHAPVLKTDEAINERAAAILKRSGFAMDEK